MPCFHPLRISNASGVFTVPCGKCAFCLQQKRQNWTVRNLITLNASNNPCYFITLTYAPEYCPPEISKRDLQLFFKRLRKYTNIKNLKYFACGEYGLNFGRPHYHALLYNVPMVQQELKEYILKAWKFGFVTIAEPSVARIKYTCKYILKSVNQQDVKLQKPFLLCSKGIGAEIGDDAAVVEFVKNNQLPVIHYGGLSYSLPKYTLSKMLDEDEYTKIMETKRKFCEEAAAENLRQHIRGNRHFLDQQSAHEQFMELQLKKTHSNHETI